MKHQLRQITSSALNIPSSIPHLHSSPKKEKSIRELLSVNAQHCLDFKECIPGSVHEKRLAISLKEQQSSARIISMIIVCQDQTLNDLPEYIFGVRKENSFEYFDEFRFKALQKGTYNFIVGVKTPNIPNYLVKAKLFLSVEGVKDSIQLELKQQTNIPLVRCCKELLGDDGQRMIKLAVVKNKTKKQTKLVFKSSENANLTLLSQVIGINNQSTNEIEVKPKTVQTGKGMFLVTVSTNCPTQLKEKYCLRRVLLFKIKDTQCYYHFPLEVVFYPQGTQGVVSQS